MNDDEVLTKLEKILESLHTGVCITDGGGIILYLGKSCEQLYGVNPKKYVNRHVSELQAEGIFVPSITLVALEKRQKVSMTQSGHDKQKLLVTATPIFDEDGMIKYVISYASWDSEDVIELQKHYDALQKEIMMNTMGGNFLNQTSDEKSLVADSYKTRELKKQLERITNSEAQVLIIGEKGTGKSHLAEYIHTRSTRAGHPFGRIDCGVYTGKMLEDELFGYVNIHPSSGEEVEKVGLCEILDSGTLLLENIENMSDEAQGLLLSLLKNKYYYKRNGKVAKRVNIRVIATSTETREKLVECLKEGLYYRLAVALIQCPSLRERKADIPGLVTEMVCYYNKKFHRNIRITHRAVEQMEKYSWPGNLSEMKYMIQSLFLSLDKDIIEEYDLPVNVSEYSSARFASSIDLKEYLDYYEGKLILEAYTRCKTTVKLAEYLGISQASAARKLKKYKENIPDAIQN